MVHRVCNEDDGHVVQFCNGAVGEGLDSKLNQAVEVGDDLN